MLITKCCFCRQRKKGREINDAKMQHCSFLSVEGQLLFLISAMDHNFNDMFIVFFFTFSFSWAEIVSSLLGHSFSFTVYVGSMSNHVSHIHPSHKYVKHLVLNKNKDKNIWSKSIIRVFQSLLLICICNFVWE